MHSDIYVFKKKFSTHKKVQDLQLYSGPINIWISPHVVWDQTAEQQSKNGFITCSLGFNVRYVAHLLNIPFGYHSPYVSVPWYFNACDDSQKVWVWDV